MRQGCISLGEVQCDSCHNIVPYAARYLVIEEQNGVEVEGAEAEDAEKRNYCVTCSLDRGYAKYREEKSERVLTFFPEEPGPEPEPEPEPESE